MLAKPLGGGRRVSSQGRLDEVVTQIAEAGGEARAYQLDVVDKNQVKAVVDAIIARFRGTRRADQHAGVMPIRPMAEVNTDEGRDDPRQYQVHALWHCRRVADLPQTGKRPHH